MSFWSHIGGHKSPSQLAQNGTQTVILAPSFMDTTDLDYIVHKNAASPDAISFSDSCNFKLDKICAVSPLAAEVPPPLNPGFHNFGS